MSYEVEITYEYYQDGSLREFSHRVGRLNDTVPEELGDISFLDYRKIAAQQALSTVVREWFILPTDEHTYCAVHHSTVVDVRATTVKTLDLE